MAYKSVAESAVLAAALHRSRMQWLCDGIFKRYWTKPIKKKGVTEAIDNNPDVKSMQRIGSCTITIEPHTLDATVYVVREALPPAPPPSMPLHRPPIASPAPQPIQPQIRGGDVVKKEGTPARIPTPVQKPSLNGGLTHQVRPPPPAQPAPPKPNTDPVIQMLASRAANDPTLKALMKIVASSQATPEQLKTFQGHIDELNAIVRRQQEAERTQKARNAAGIPNARPTPISTSGKSSTVPTKTPNTTTNPASPYGSAPSTPGAWQPPYHNVPQLSATPRPVYTPTSRPEAPIKHVILEFSTQVDSNTPASADRWLFPEYAVFEPIMHSHHDMVCSFLVTQKGSEILARPDRRSAEGAAAVSENAKWDPDTMYYQPVTMMMHCINIKTQDSILRAAKPLPEVQQYMRDVLEKGSRAPVEYLVPRLPREKASTVDGLGCEFVDSAVELGSADEDDELKDFYGN